MSIVNPLNHPQVIFLGFEPDDPRLERLRRLVATPLVLSSQEELSGLRLADWDALVVEGDAVPHAATSEMHVLALGSVFLGVSNATWANITLTGEQPSRVLHIAEDIGADLRRLVLTETIPWLDAQPQIPYLQKRAIGTGARPVPRDLEPHLVVGWKAIIRDADQNIVLGGFPRPGGSKWCWAIPYRSPLPELWLNFAMAQWRALDPELFPEVDPWRGREPWITTAEREALAELRRLRERHRRSEEEFRAQELELEAAAIDAAQTADQADRRLLTEQGDSLVEAVHEALAQLGFDVVDVDGSRAGEGLARAEDLVLSPPEQSALKIIAEVKGSARGGAKAGDLLQLSQHALRYTQRMGTAPDRQWYIVNQFAASDPDTRQQALAGAPEDVQVFADGGGLILDTRDLFQLVQLVTAQQVTATRAREVLLAQRGLFSGSGITTAERRPQ